jgi:hypothetical protein
VSQDEDGVAPCRLVDVYLMVEVVSTSETSVNFHQTTWRNIPEDSHLQDEDILLILYCNLLKMLLFKPSIANNSHTCEHFHLRKSVIT